MRAFFFAAMMSAWREPGEAEKAKAEMLKSGKGGMG
jgi:hypothetical protein